MDVHIQELLQATIDEFASDLHIRAHMPPKLRVNGVLLPIADEELTEDGELDEEIADALADHVTIFAEVGEDEVKELCAAYAGKTRDELASQFYLLGFDDIPGEDEEEFETL